MKGSRGQAALLLIMVMAVVGAVSVGVASRAVENLRVAEIENISSQAFRAAEAGLELALSTKADVAQTQLGAAGVTYQATYASAGSDGFVADSVDEGDVVQISLAGASAGLTGLNIYWNSNTAIKASVFSGNTGTGVYAVVYSTGDPDAARRVNNKFSAPGAGGAFKSVSFGSKITVPIDMAADPSPKMIRILVLYQSSSIGVEPVGGTLASDQIVSVTGTGKVVVGTEPTEPRVVTNLSFSKFSERTPAIFDNILYSNSSISQ